MKSRCKNNYVFILLFFLNSLLLSCFKNTEPSSSKNEAAKSDETQPTEKAEDNEGENPEKEHKDAANVHHEKTDSAEENVLGEPKEDPFAMSDNSLGAEDHPICLKFLRSIPNEKYLYHMQGLRNRFASLSQDHLYIEAHLRYQKLLSNTEAREEVEKVSNSCSTALASIQRFGDVERLNQLEEGLALQFLHRRRALLALREKVFPLRNCALFLSRIKTKREFSRLKKELASHNEGDVPEIVMSSFLQLQNTAGLNLSGREVSVQSCMAAIRSFKKFEDIKTFAQSSPKQQYESLKPYSWQRSKILAH